MSYELNEAGRKYDDNIEKLVLETCAKDRNASLANLLDQTLARFYSIASSSGEHEQFGQTLLRQILPAWTRMLDSQLQIENEHGKELSLRAHCDLLGKAISSIGTAGHLSSSSTQVDGEVLSWIDASKWLEVGASVDRVDVDTGYFDDSIMFCGSAYEYQRARSAELSYLVQQLTVFNFVWGSLETVIKLIKLPKVPARL